ncbi:MAG: hypothetical protein ACP5QO_17645 [Clostridia bacterium]
MWLLLAGSLLVAPILLRRVLRLVMTGVAVLLASLAVWLFWSPAAAWHVIGPVVRPATLAVSRHLDRDLHLYTQWATRTALGTPPAPHR